MKAIILLTMFCAGCTSVHTPVTQEVRVPVYVPCIDQATLPARPDFEVEHLAESASDGAKVLALARDLTKHLKYEGMLVAIVDGCR